MKVSRTGAIRRALVPLLFLLAAFFSYPGVEAAGSNTYDMLVKLDFERSQLSVTEKVVYFNRSSATVSSVVFNVSPVHFKAFKLLSAKVDGRDVDTRFDDVSLEVSLPLAVDPGEFIGIDLQFDLDVPSVGGRFGKYDQVMALGNWYPVLAIYRDGWQKHSYTAFGDPFVTEVADYEVTVESRSKVEIAHTGNLVKREGDTWRFKAEKVRDFAMALSDRFETKSAVVDGIKLTAFNVRGHSAAASLYIDAGSLALRWLNKNIGTYPYESLQIVEVNPGKEDMVGQEYPNLVFISSAYSGKPEGVKSYAGYLIVHEIGHQWFYGLVGNDQLKEPWLDEALVTYLAYRVLDWAPLALSSTAVAPSGQSPVNSTVYDFKDETQYSATTYGKGAVFLQELAAALKGNGIDDALRGYVDLYRHKLATSRGFLGLVQSRTTTNLNPLLKRYFSYSDYKAESPLKVEIEWPKEDTWDGPVRVGFRSDAVIRRVEVDADGVSMLKADNPSSPLSVDASNLIDGDYVVGIAVFDENGRVVQSARRIQVSGGLPVRPALAKWRPTPTAAPAGAAIPATFNVQLPDYRPSLSTSVTVDLGGILVGVSVLSAFFVLTVVFLAFQSRRSWSKNFQFSGHKPSKRASAQAMAPRAETLPVARPSHRPASTIVPVVVSTSPRQITDSRMVAPALEKGSVDVGETAEPSVSSGPAILPSDSVRPQQTGPARACRLEGHMKSGRHKENQGESNAR